MKIESDSVDVAVRACNEVKVRELTGIYAILNRKKYNSKNIGLYRNDGLVVLKIVSGPAAEKIKNNYNLCSSKKACK